ncbi:hypothetical protein Athai_58180 [Actinocatenispora thailandica]|uniref:Uncharacterized protein n=1 Tax=Actinocatenispora thailandica TaxID=227318 RepID=A0A7R7DV72_9ACTN|nr:hypothetical protein [Actinocatenispora thailandica]BCJ38315.1 hypothetical protein Athai_58180 [Actinocatenispora thailandica]
MPAVTGPAERRYLRVVRASAGYDLVVTAGFCTPWSYPLVHAALSGLGDRLGLGTLPALEPAQVLYANLLGSIVVVWAVLRLRRPSHRYGGYDGAARALFALWQATALAHGFAPVLWPFLAMEVAFGVAELAPLAWSRLRRDAVPADSVEPAGASDQGVLS